MTQSADLLITNAHVFTADAARPFVEAVAVSGNRIVLVGSAAEAQAWRGSGTRVVDGQGATLMPGIIDSHYHLHLGSMGLAHIQLDKVESLGELTEVIRRYAHAHPDEPYITGAQLRYEVMPAGQPLTRQHLDAIVSDRSLTIMAYDYHTAWANTRALEVAGKLRDITNRPGSAIVTDADGVATGELIEPLAYAAVLGHFEAWDATVKSFLPDEFGKPTYGSARDQRWIREGLKLTARHGITSIHNMDGNAAQAAFYAGLEAAGELTTRISIPYSVVPTTRESDLDEAVEMTRLHQGDKLRAGRAKFFMDGVIESWTAFLLNDYADRPSSKGEALYSAEHFNRMAAACDARGLQITVHAVGDAAVRRTLDGYAHARQVNGVRDSRHRVEHIELVHPADIPRFAKLGVIASFQPLHCILDYPQTPEFFPERVGRDAWHRSFAWQYLRGGGARVAFGSDWPVVTQDAMLGIHNALNRQAWGADQPDHRQSLSDTLLSYTRDGAYTEFQEHQKGQLKVGYLADMVLLSADLFQTADASIKEVHPVMTICDGQVVYEG
ncbi:MAG: amidohydrolase [Chloroflexi bacterium]|nr:amidohydrolase [Chloroflexota bacterium]MCC6896231.1 amidohydrolase [Anaerolineae bacterium]